MLEQVGLGVADPASGRPARFLRQAVRPLVHVGVGQQVGVVVELVMRCRQVAAHGRRQRLTAEVTPAIQMHEKHSMLRLGERVPFGERRYNGVPHMLFPPHFTPKFSNVSQIFINK